MLINKILLLQYSYDYISLKRYVKKKELDWFSVVCRFQSNISFMDWKKFPLGIGKVEMGQ